MEVKSKEHQLNVFKEEVAAQEKSYTAILNRDKAASKHQQDFYTAETARLKAASDEFVKLDENRVKAWTDKLANELEAQRVANASKKDLMDDKFKQKELEARSNLDLRKQALEEAKTEREVLQKEFTLKAEALMNDRKQTEAERLAVFTEKMGERKQDAEEKK